MAVFILAFACWGLVLGLVLGWLKLVVPGAASAIVLGLGLCVIVAAWSFGRQRAMTVGCIVAGCIFGLMLWQNSLVINEYQSLYGQDISLEGEVVERPVLTQGGNQAVIIRPDGFTQLVRVSLFHHAYVEAGNKVWLQGELKEPENFDDFNYVAYLKQKNIYAEAGKAKVIVMSDSGFKLDHWLNDLRQTAIRRGELRLSEPAAAMVLGMLIGERDKLPGNIEDSFRKTGLIHILVVSGFNLTLIASGVGVSARIIRRKPADYLSLVTIWLFVALVGASSAVVRAGIMASLLIAARLFGRLALSSVSLLVAVAIMSAANPWQLFYDIGFQLSIAATWGVLQANVLRLRFGQEGWLGELLWPSFGAIVATAPIISYYFGTFSLTAPLANIMILPMVPLTMLLGALSLLPFLQVFFAPLVEALVSAQLHIVAVLAKWRFSEVGVKMHSSVIISYYAFIIFATSLLKHGRKTRLKKYDSNDTMTKIII